MPEILLVRHGRPACDHRTRIRGRDFDAWVRAYKTAPLDVRLAPPPMVQARAAGAACIVTSMLHRARESAAILAPGRPVVADALFDEAGIPTRIDVGLRLSPAYWDGLARMAWLLGWSPETESVRNAAERARRGADYLTGMATERGSVVLVGHGMMNTLIFRALRRSGWSGGGSPRGYWGLVSLHRTQAHSVPGRNR